MKGGDIDFDDAGTVNNLKEIYELEDGKSPQKTKVANLRGGDD
jgi:hypothetical protein